MCCAVNLGILSFPGISFKYLPPSFIPDTHCMQWFHFLIYLVSFRWWLTKLQLPSKTMPDRFYNLNCYVPHHFMLMVMSLVGTMLLLLNNSQFIFALLEMHSGCGFSWTLVGLYKDAYFLTYQELTEYIKLASQVILSIFKRKDITFICAVFERPYS